MSKLRDACAAAREHLYQCDDTPRGTEVIEQLEQALDEPRWWITAGRYALVVLGVFGGALFTVLALWLLTYIAAALP